MASTASSSASSAATSATIQQIPGELIQDGKHLVKISEENRNLVFLSPDIFKGKIYVNIREYFIPEEEKQTGTSDEEEEEEEAGPISTVPYMKATKKGVCLTELEFNLMINKLNRVQTLIKRLKKRQNKAEFRLGFSTSGVVVQKRKSKSDEPPRQTASSHH